jgi:hypothetical protein
MPEQIRFQLRWLPLASSLRSTTSFQNSFTVGTEAPTPQYTDVLSDWEPSLRAATTPATSHLA